MHKWVLNCELTQLTYNFYHQNSILIFVNDFIFTRLLRLYEQFSLEMFMPTLISMYYLIIKKLCLISVGLAQLAKYIRILSSMMKYIYNLYPRVTNSIAHRTQMHNTELQYRQNAQSNSRLLTAQFYIQLVFTAPLTQYLSALGF